MTAPSGAAEGAVAVPVRGVTAGVDVPAASDGLPAIGSVLFGGLLWTARSWAIAFSSSSMRASISARLSFFA